MSDELRSPALSIGEVNALQRPLALDLTAAYAAMRDDAIVLLNRAVLEGWRPDRFLDQLQDLFSSTPKPLL